MGRLFSLTYPTAALLLAIRKGHRYGFDIMDATGLPDGTVYPCWAPAARAASIQPSRALEAE